MKFKLGDYVTIKPDAFGDISCLNGSLFKIIALENDEDRAVIMQTDRTRLNEEQRNFISRRFYYGIMSIYYMETEWTFIEEDFEELVDLDDWLEEDEDNCEEDYTECVDYEATNLSCTLSQSILTKCIKKGNSHLF